MFTERPEKYWTRKRAWWLEEKSWQDEKRTWAKQENKQILHIKGSCQFLNEAHIQIKPNPGFTGQNDMP